MKLKILKAVAVLLLISTPFLLRWSYLAYTALPETVRIATGPAEGEWQRLSGSLQRSIEQRCDGVTVQRYAEHTDGALEHLALLEQGEVDFALYLRGAQRLQEQNPGAASESVATICNLYSDVVMFVVRRDLYESSQIRVPHDLKTPRADGARRRLAVGHRQWGQYGVSQVILRHVFGNNAGRDDVELLEWDYQQVVAGFADGTLDAAILSAGYQAPIFERLFEDAPGLCRMGTIPNVDAIMMNNVSLGKITLPRALFRFQGEAIPDTAIDTIASRTTLLTRQGVSTQMVEEVTRIVLSEPFIHENQLFELSQQGVELARDNPEFPLHEGAMNVFDPHLKPLVDPDFMEATENLRSFAVSLLIAGFLVVQWWRHRAERKKDHRLDEYIAALLEIDRTQPPLAAAGERYDIQRLHQTLDRVTALRNEALREFSAKDFDEDRAADSFLNLCDTVAEGLNAKLARQQLDDRIKDLIAALQARPNETRAD